MDCYEEQLKVKNFMNYKALPQMLFIMSITMS